MIDVNYILVWIVGVSALSVLFSLRDFPPQLVRTWRTGAVITLGVLALLGLSAFEIAGLVAGAVWLLLLFSFRFGWSYVHPLAQLGRYEEAAQRARMFHRFFPWAGYGQAAQIYQLTANREPPTSVIEVRELKTLYALDAYVRLLAHFGNWSRVREVVEGIGLEFCKRYIPPASQLYVRALREEGTRTAIVKSYEVSQALAQDEADRKSEENLASRAAVTKVAAGALLLSFAAQILFGFEAVVERFAMHPILVMEFGEWWRLLTTAFLHGNAVHLATSLLGLWILGPMIEAQLKGPRTLFLLLFTAVGASLVVCFVTAQGWTEPRFLVGASGAVMGLVGAELGIALLGSRNARNRERLKRVGLVLVLQAIFDLTTPNVSFSAHIGGALSGLVCVVLLSAFRRRVGSEVGR